MLDLSWNSIGKIGTKLFASQLGEVLTTQDNLLHLDISHNNIKSEEINTIAKSLELNHSLWGLHIFGNEGYIDSKAFLHPGQRDKREMNIATEHLAHRINGIKMVVLNSDREDTKIKRINNCWLCEGWNEVLVEWPLSNYITNK